MALQVTPHSAAMTPVHLGLGPRNLTLHLLDSNVDAKRLYDVLTASALLHYVGQWIPNMATLTAIQWQKF